ncbi:MAG: SagB/ThcOx family dehydrogenase [Candidatus Bathyarchaeia archaeon]|nr:SagB/ThcOx family dehydrogenase [Candidatus Bathyarchaeota archaeon]
MVIKVEKAAWLLSLLLVLSIILYVIYITLPVKRPLINDTFFVSENKVFLPLPQKVSNLTVEEAILSRRSIRDYTDDPVSIGGLAMILWSAYGITDPERGFRASPSAGATYPLEIYIVVGEKGVAIKDGFLEAGVYKYEPHSHSLLLVKKGDYRSELMKSALGQEWVGEAPLTIIICAVFERTTKIYGERGQIRYVPMEAGHAGQNIYLMATALNYGAVVVGAFYDDSVATVVGVKPEEKPLYIIPLGVPERPYYKSFEDIGEYITSRRG